MNLLRKGKLRHGFSEFPEHSGSFLPLAGFSVVKEVRDNAAISVPFTA